MARHVFLQQQVARHLEANLALSTASRAFIAKLFMYIGHPHDDPDTASKLPVAVLREKSHPILIKLLLEGIAKNPKASLPMRDAVRAYAATSK